MAEYINREALVSALEDMVLNEPFFLTKEVNCAVNGGIRISVRIAKKIPAADVVEVVRCKDCIHRVEPSKMCAHPKAIGWDALEPNDDDFCSYGERKEQK